MSLADPVAELALFARIVSAGSLSGAARELGVEPAAVSKRLSRMEARLGARLLHRTSRALSLTPEGAVLHERSLSILADIAEVEATVSAGRLSPRGLLRITATVSFGRRYVAPAAQAFTDTYPQTSVRLSLSDGVVDLVEGGFDLAVRIGRPDHADLIARRIASNDRVVCAAPSYLARASGPRTPEDLSSHACLMLERAHGRQDRWSFIGPEGEERTVKVSGPLASDNGEAIHDWAVAGAGLALKSVWDVADDLAAGRLVPVLDGWRAPTADIFAVYPSRQQLSAKTRLFVDLLAKRLANAAPALSQTSSVAVSDADAAMRR